MCDHCHSSPPPPETRRTFLRKVAGAVATAALLGSTRARAQEVLSPAAKTAWGRLITPNPIWNFHRDQDPQLAHFIRTETTLKIAPTSDPVTPADLDQLCAYSFIFSNYLAEVFDPGDLLNLQEYLYRGGFIYVDACTNPHATPNFLVFYERHLALFAHLAPGSEVRRLPSNHPIFRAYFPVDERRRSRRSRPAERPARNGAEPSPHFTGFSTTIG